MKLLASTLALGVLALSLPVAAKPALAEQVILSRSKVDDGYARLRKNCDQRGRCWTEGHRNLLLDSYNYMPPPKRVTSNVP